MISCGVRTSRAFAKIRRLGARIAGARIGHSSALSVCCSASAHLRGFRKMGEKSFLLESTASSIKYKMEVLSCSGRINRIPLDNTSESD